MKLFFDTNVLLDVLAKREPFYRDALQLWSLAERRELHGYISTLSLNNVYYIVRKWGGKQKAQEALVILRDIFDLVAEDHHIVNQSIDAGMNEFEDAVQFCSAIRINADYLVTRNPKHFPVTAMPVILPDELIALLSI